MLGLLDRLLEGLVEATAAEVGTGTNPDAPVPPALPYFSCTGIDGTLGSGLPPQSAQDLQLLEERLPLLVVLGHREDVAVRDHRLRPHEIQAGLVPGRHVGEVDPKCPPSNLRPGDPSPVRPRIRSRSLLRSRLGG